MEDAEKRISESKNGSIVIFKIKIVWMMSPSSEKALKTNIEPDYLVMAQAKSKCTVPCN